MAGNPPPDVVIAPERQPVALRTKGALLAALVALWLMLNELSLLSAGFLPAEGSAWSFNAMTGPAVAQQLNGWHQVLDGTQLVHWQKLLLFGYLPLDVLFIIGYTTAGFVFTTSGSWIRKLVVAIAVFDVLETLALLVLGLQRCRGGDCVRDWLVMTQAVFSSLKWAGIIAVVLAALIAIVQSQRTRQLWRALVIQRFGLLAFLPIAVLSIVPGSFVFDQLPDVQRRWIDPGGGMWHALWAGLVYGVILLPTVFMLGRIRADWAVRRWIGQGYWPYYDAPGPAGPRRQKIWLWVLGPVVLVPIALVLDLLGYATVFWPRLLVFCAIPFVVVLVSRFALQNWNPAPRELRLVSDRFPRDVLAIGDVLVVASLSLAGLGMVRAFTGLASVEAVGLLDASYALEPIVALLIGLFLTIVPWLFADWVRNALAVWGEPEYDQGKRVRSWLGRLAAPGVDLAGDDVLTAGDPAGGGVTGAPQKVLRPTLLGLSIAGFLALAIWPRWIADQLGVLAATMLVLTALMTMIGSVVVYAQERQPPEMFQVGPQFIRLRATPIIWLLVIALAVTGLVGGKTDIHPVDASGTVPARPTMQQAFEAWLAQDGACSIPVDESTAAAEEDGIHLRPMLMIAAEGGGIRATYWTASALQRISAAGEGCGRRSALFSAGASGGALGLTIARFADQPLSAVESIAGHEALGTAMVSLLSGDLLASATGLRFTASAPYRDPTRQPLDRSELMETWWERELDELRTPFLPSSLDAATAEDGAVTGQLILTSAAVNDGCNALVSQVDLNADAKSEDGRPVCGAGKAGKHNYDLFGAYGRTVGDDKDQCLGNVPALTAGLLASRFPYVTPSGVVEDCRGLEEAQLVDGGYTDNTGLGTIVDLAPTWKDLVRVHNDKVLADKTGDFVVPLVAYIENGTGADYSTGASKAVAPDARVEPGSGSDWAINWMQIPESVVPIVTPVITAKGNKTSSRPLLADAAAAVGADTLCTTSPSCVLLQKDPRVTTRVFVIHQSTQPSVSAPLGWVLSAASQKDLADDLQLQADESCKEDCFATLGDLLATLAPVKTP